jgi:ABC-type transporter Mla subunit MlaD
MAPRTQRRNIYRRRAQGIRPFWSAVAGVTVVALIAVLIYFAETSGNGIPFASYRTVNVSVPNIGHLQAHDPVEIAGVYVGQVKSIGTLHNRPLATLQLGGVGPLPVNTHAIVRGYGLLGARYMEVDPGTSSQMLPNGGTITENSQANSYTWGLPDALNLFNPKTRNALGYMWRGFGTGLEGRGQQLNSAIHVGPGSGADFDQAAYAILARPGVAQAFLPDQNSGWTALNSTASNLTDMFSPAATTAQAFVDERQPTEQFIIAFQQLQAALTPPLATNELWNSAITLSHTLAKVLPQTPSALRSAATFLKNTQQPLRNTIPALNEVPQAVPPTLHILTSLRPDLAPLHQALTNLVGPVSSLSEHGCDIQSFATGARGLTALGTVPGGNWGPDVGFPISFIIQPQALLSSYVKTGKSPFVNTSGYYPPCEFAPGAVINSSTYLAITSGLLGNVL